MKEQAVAIQAQNIYAENKGYISMPDATVLETQQAAQNAESSKTEEKEEKAIKEFKEQEKRLRAQRRQELENRSSKEKTEKEKPQKHPWEEKYFPKGLPNDPEIQKRAYELCEAAGGKDLEEVDTRILVKHFLRLDAQVQRSRRNRDFLEPIEGQLVDRDRNVEGLRDAAGELVSEELKEAWEKDYKQRGIDLDSLSVDEQRTIEELIKRRMPPASGGAETIDTSGITRVELLRIANEINTEATRFGEGREFLVDDLNRQRTRIQGLIDGGTFADEAEVQQAQGLINTLNQRLDTAHTAQEAAQEAAYARRDRDEEQFNLKVNAEEAEKIQLATDVDEEVQRGATRVRQAIQGGGVKNEDLRREIDHFLERRDEIERQVDRAFGTDITGLEKKAKEIRGFISQLRTIKEFLNSRERLEYLETNPRAEGIYGDIKLTSGEKRELVQLALEGNVEELKRHFSKLFESAEARTSDDWRDAGGSRQQIEVDLFTGGLDNVASKRIAFKDSKQKDEHGQPKVRELKDWEVDRLRKVSRELSQEMKLRQLLHDVTYYANKDFGIEELRKLTRQITADEVDYALGTPGVAKVAHYFEQAMLQVVAENGGFLPAEAMTNESGGEPGRVEKLVREQIKIDQNLGTLDLEDWHVERAISMARGMNIVTFRAFSIIAKHGIPPERGPALGSWWANNIIKKLAFFRQITRFDVGKQRNRFLATRIERRGKVWRTKELEEIKDLGTAEILNKFVNESDDDRFIDMINPAQVGDVFTQTQWRWGESEYHAGAIAHLLDGYRYNPIIGAGMWLEKARRMFGPEENTRLKEEQISDAKKQLGKDVSTEGELAKALIDRNLDLAADISPLKLFYNMIGLRQQVLRNHYKIEEASEDGKKSGRIFIKDENLEKDLEALAVIQEGLLRRRADLYIQYLKAKETNPNLRPPNLYSDHTDLDAEIEKLRDKLESGQADRILTFIRHVRTEFVKPNQKGKLMANLKDKGWKIPFIFGTDDLPYDLYDFSKTGNSLDRRWGDNESVAQAADVFTKKLLERMADFRDQETIINVMKEIHDTMKGHDESRTRDFMLFLSEAIIKFYKKDILARMPAGLGLLKDQLGGIIGKESSYARIAFKDPTQMAWDEIAIDAFIKKTMGAGLINPEDIKTLKERTGARNWNLLLALTRTMAPLTLLALLYYLFQSEIKDLKQVA